MTQELNSEPKRKVNVPQTSRDAHDSVKELKQKIKDEIVKALEEMKVGGTSEEIAIHLEMEHSRVWKRLSELQEDNVIFNTGILRKTSSGRKAMVRQLCKFTTHNLLSDKYL